MRFVNCIKPLSLQFSIMVACLTSKSRLAFSMYADADHVTVRWHCRISQRVFMVHNHKLTARPICDNTDSVVLSKNTWQDCNKTYDKPGLGNAREARRNICYNLSKYVSERVEEILLLTERLHSCQWGFWRDLRFWCLPTLRRWWGTSSTPQTYG